jgi:hypothetical protein
MQQGEEEGNRQGEEAGVSEEPLATAALPAIVLPKIPAPIMTHLERIQRLVQTVDDTDSQLSAAVAVEDAVWRWLQLRVWGPGGLCAQLLKRARASCSCSSSADEGTARHHLLEAAKAAEQELSRAVTSAPDGMVSGSAYHHAEQLVQHLVPQLYGSSTAPAGTSRLQRQLQALVASSVYWLLKVQEYDARLATYVQEDGKCELPGLVIFVEGQMHVVLMPVLASQEGPLCEDAF